MKHFPFFLLLLTIVTGASADVLTSNTYYTQGSTVYESVTLKDNAEFANVVGISYDSIVGISGGWPVADDEDSSFATSVTIDSKNVGVGGQTSVQAEDAYWSKKLTGGNTNGFVLSYGLGTGNAESEGYHSQSSFEDNLVSDQAYYSGTITGSDDEIALSGRGVRISLEDTDSQFEHGLRIGHDGKWANIEGDADCVKEGSHDVTPTIYIWHVDVTGDNRLATSEMSIGAVAGDRYLDASITGTCSVPGLLPEGGASETLHLDPLDDTLSIEDPSLSDLVDLLNTGFTGEIYTDFVVS